ncbi:PREDICTED: F-box protein CPR30-like [Fragaria vesca subsp. vesca]
MSDYLPQEVISEIFLRLPVKSLVIFTSVCKSWGSIIKSLSFIQAHLSHRISFNDLHDTHLLLLHGVSLISYRSDFGLEDSFYGLKREVYSLHYDNLAFTEYCKIAFHHIPIADRKMSNECFRVVGICNGLIFLADDISHSGYKFIIWNPVIRKLVTLPKPGLTFETHGRYNACHGFAFDASTNDYKAVRLSKFGFVGDTANQTYVEVYSLASGSWSEPKLVDIDPLCAINRCSPQAFVNPLHWDARSLSLTSISYRCFILAFDVSPDRKSLAMFITNPNVEEDLHLDIWEMKEYAVQESWTKLITLRPQGPLQSGDVALVCLCSAVSTIFCLNSWWMLDGPF